VTRHVTTIARSSRVAVKDSKGEQLANVEVADADFRSSKEYRGTIGSSPNPLLNRKHKGYPSKIKQRSPIQVTTQFVP